jgi:RNA polymerase sigma factor (sigma-70 family)
VVDDVTTAAVQPHFADWYERSHGRVLATIVVTTGRPSLASEATDEAFARALARWERVSAMGSPIGWVIRVAHNYARRSIRRAAMEQSFFRKQRPLETIDGPAGEAWDLVRALAPQQRMVITLRYVADLPESEIARIMGLRRGTVSAHHHAAIQGLRARLLASERDTDTHVHHSPPTDTELNHRLAQDIEGWRP